MWSNFRRYIVFFCSLFPCLLFSQKEEKMKFEKEKFLNFKVGTIANFTNSKLYEILNFSDEDVFSSAQNPNYNPSADIEFENHFSKYIGINLGIGFMQTRHHYTYKYNGPIVNPNKYLTDGFIICNIPHFNINPLFYLNDTRFFVGLGIYKYYYAFKPMDIGTIRFNLNSEGLAFYSNIGVTQSFDIKTYKLTFTVNYFGLTKQYDHGLNIALGLSI